MGSISLSDWGRGGGKTQYMGVLLVVPGSADLEGQGQSPDISPSPYQLNWNSAKPFSLVLPFEIRR